MIKSELNFLDLFSGIGGFAKGFEDAGFTFAKHYFSEIDKHAIANYKHNFKHSDYAGSVESISGTSLGKVDVITFGSPCQDFSIAGKGEGIGGERSGLILEAIRLIDEKKPAFFIWENVKGAFSTNDGADFFAILQAFANLGCYNIEWQLLNTLWVLPQNRERIYLVGHLAAPERSFKPVFPFTKNDRLFIEGKRPGRSQPQAEYCSTVNGGDLRADATIIQYCNPLMGAAHGLHRDMTVIKSEVPAKARTLTGGGGNSGGLHRDMTMIKSTHYGTHQQDRYYDVSGAMACLVKDRLQDKVNINLNAGTDEETYRRLTEIECERVQGFPDDWTKFGNYNGKIKKIASTNRYKMIGNAVTKNFPELIAKKLIENYLL